MIETLATELGVSAAVAWAIIALAALQLAVQVWALIDLGLRPKVRFGMKWLWALIIILGGNMLIGPIVYLAVGRNVPEEVDVAKPPLSGDGNGDRTRRAVDTLYGEGEGR